MDVLTKEQRRKNMQAIKSKDTKMEVALAKAIFAPGHRIGKNDHTVFGAPELTFKHEKIAVFVDSEYFHGKDWNLARFHVLALRFNLFSHRTNAYAEKRISNVIPNTKGLAS